MIVHDGKLRLERYGLGFDNSGRWTTFSVAKSMTSTLVGAAIKDGYQWWTYSDGTFAARGIFGQGIFIDPKRKVVIVSNANWAGGATDRVASEAREALYRAVLRAVDDESAGMAGSPAKP